MNINNSDMLTSIDKLIEMAKIADEENRPATCVELLIKAQNMCALLPPRARLRLAENLRIIGRIDEARKVLATMSDVPEDKKWLVNLQGGQVELDTGNLLGAISLFKEALKENSISTIPYVYLAGAYVMLQKYQLAIEVLLQGAHAKGDVDEVYLNLGYAYRTIGEYALAKEAFANALKITATYKEAILALSDVENAESVS